MTTIKTFYCKKRIRQSLVDNYISNNTCTQTKETMITDFINISHHSAEYYNLIKTSDGKRPTYQPHILC